MSLEHLLDSEEKIKLVKIAPDEYADEDLNRYDYEDGIYHHENGEIELRSDEVETFTRICPHCLDFHFNLGSHFCTHCVGRLKASGDDIWAKELFSNKAIVSGSGAIGYASQEGYCILEGEDISWIPCGKN